MEASQKKLSRTTTRFRSKSSWCSCGSW